MFYDRIYLNLVLPHSVSRLRLKLKLSGQATFISTILSCLCSCHNSYKLLLSFAPGEFSVSKVKFRQASTCCKKVFEVAKLTKESIIFWKLGSTMVNLLYLFYFRTLRCCLLHLIKENCLLKYFLRTLILTSQVFLYLFSFLEQP